MNVQKFAEIPEMKLKPLIDLAVNGLENMFDNEKGLFCHRIRQTPNGMVREGLSRRYTIISLLGLHQYESQGGRSPIDVSQILMAIIKDIGKIDNIGDLGLLLWLCALADHKQLKFILSNLDIRESLKKYPDARKGKTTELAWFLAGLSHCALTSEQDAENLKELANQTFELIKGNYGGKGIFGHLKKETITGMMRGRIGCFADQVYPIYALSTFSNAYGNQDALGIALDCGRAICQLQGPFGQWWWHYDATTGKMIGKYPVYSVHQDGMAPFALFALEKVAGIHFVQHINKGLQWIYGENERKKNLVDARNALIWRCFYQNLYRRYFDEAIHLIRVSKNNKNTGGLKILYECRPYHLGWLLYAFADKIMVKIDFELKE